MAVSNSFKMVFLLPWLDRLICGNSPMLAMSSVLRVGKHHDICPEPLVMNVDDTHLMPYGADCLLPCYTLIGYLPSTVVVIVDHNGF